jgi:hypothetical protein
MLICDWRLASQHFSLMDLMDTDKLGRVPSSLLLWYGHGNRVETTRSRMYAFFRM